jgi:hypothetical protein
MPPKFCDLWNRIRLRNNPSEANLTGLTLPRPVAIAHLPKCADYFTSAFLTREPLTEIARTPVANISALADPRAFVNGSVVT